MFFLIAFLSFYILYNDGKPNVKIRKDYHAKFAHTCTMYENTPSNMYPIDDCRNRVDYMKSKLVTASVNNWRDDNITELYERYPRLLLATFISNSSTSLQNCSDATKYSHIIDITCSFRWGFGNFYHSIADCLLPNLKLLLSVQHYKNAALYISRKEKKLFLPIVQLLLPEQEGNSYEIFLSETNCLILRPQAKVYYELRYFQHDYHDIVDGVYIENVNETMVENAQIIKHVLWNNLGLPANSKRGTFLIVQRLYRRSFLNIDIIVKYFQSVIPKHLTVDVYYGNETLVETITKFYHAKVVFGFHGAGFINTLFCHSKTIVLELTHLLNNQTHQIWRTNDLTPLHGSLQWMTYSLFYPNSPSFPNCLQLKTCQTGGTGSQYTLYITLVNSDLVNTWNMIKDKLIIKKNNNKYIDTVENRNNSTIDFEAEGGYV